VCYCSVRLGQLGMWIFRSSQLGAASPTVTTLDRQPDFFAFPTRFNTQVITCHLDLESHTVTCHPKRENTTPRLNPVSQTGRYSLYLSRGAGKRLS